MNSIICRTTALSHILIFNQFSFELNNMVPIREESYLELYNEHNTYILEWQNSGLGTLEEFVGSSQYGQILNRVIPGYYDNPNLSPNYTIGGRLQKYADAVIAPKLAVAVL